MDGSHVGSWHLPNLFPINADSVSLSNDYVAFLDAADTRREPAALCCYISAQHHFKSALDGPAQAWQIVQPLCVLVKQVCPPQHQWTRDLW